MLEPGDQQEYRPILPGEPKRIRPSLQIAQRRTATADADELHYPRRQPQGMGEGVLAESTG
jgi:hypothetical protein